MKKRQLLIISSERLNPDEIIPSTFELTQARILSEKMDVCILSIQIQESFLFKVKAIFKSLYLGKGSTEFITLCKQALKTAKQIISGNKIIVRQHVIENIPVYEGVAFSKPESLEYISNLNAWLEVGHFTYKNYVKKRGKPDLIHAHGRYVNAAILAQQIKERDGIKYIYTEHSTVFQMGNIPAPVKFLMQEAIENASQFLVVSPSLKKYIEEFLGKGNLSAIVFPNVLDPIFEMPLKLNSNSKNRCKLFSVGSLEYKKGFDILLKSFALASKTIPELYLQICGDGELKEELEKLSFDLGINTKVDFLGEQSKERVQQIMDDSDIFILASRVETFGVVVIEALARGCPVIATCSGGPEYIIDHDCGVLVNPDDIDQLTEAIIEMTKNLKQYSKEKLSETAIGKFGSKTFLEKSLTIYNDVLA